MPGDVETVEVSPMNLSNSLSKVVVCVAVLGVGCVNEPLTADDAPGDEYADGEENEGFVIDWGSLGAGATVVGVETLDVTMPSSLHAQGLALPAKLVRPKWSEPVGKRGGMLVLHGSGGLLKTPKDKSNGPTCINEMETQFVVWAERLAKQGYTVVLPSSYSVRGFCDKHDDIARIPNTFDDKAEQILGRMYDLDAASRYMCSRPEIDCDRMGVMGFSQGGTMTMLALHWQFEHAIQYFRETKADEVDIPIPDVKPGRPEFQVGIAYYPGCGFDGLVPLSTSTKAAKENKFTPTAPLTVLHGSVDPLVDHCSVQYGAGGREIQSGQLASLLDLDDQYKVNVYKNAEHGFDYKDDTSSNKNARDAALAVTLDQLKLHLN
jgi:dienelactone hydrolase